MEIQCFFFYFKNNNWVIGKKLVKNVISQIKIAIRKTVESNENMIFLSSSEIQAKEFKKEFKYFLPICTPADETVNNQNRLH